MWPFGSTISEAKFIEKYMTAVKRRDHAATVAILQKKFKCSKCQQLVVGVCVANLSGGLRCPNCGNDWGCPDRWSQGL